jgi:hypothetical protein
MNPRIWRLWIAGLWLALPAVALIYARMWDQIPQRLATHFNAAGRPNGWMSPAGSLTFGLVFLTIILSVGTVLLTRVRKPDTSSWALLGLFYVIAGVFVYTEQATLDYNLHGTPIDFSAIVVPVPIAVVLAMSVFIASKRGSGLPVAPVVAEEVHASRMWGLVIAAPVAIVLAVTAVVPNIGVRLALGAVGLTTLGAAAMAWSGFQYVFTNSGLEIRTLGFRLRSIPKEDIRDYATDSWSVAGGYGIRGIGDRRAYVWGNKGVRIRTNHGEVFLGHNDPDRIVHDLDLIKQFAH